MLFAKCCELDVPLAIHPTFIPQPPPYGVFDWPARGQAWAELTWLRAIVQQALISFFALGTLERFPALRLGILEVGAGWLGAFLDRLDAVTKSLRATVATDSSVASVSFPPIRTTAAPLTVDHVGAECSLWATDYPHPDHPHTSLTSRVLPSNSRRRRDLAGDVGQIYRLGN